MAVLVVHVGTKQKIVAVLEKEVDIPCNGFEGEIKVRFELFDGVKPLEESFFLQGFDTTKGQPFVEIKRRLLLEDLGFQDRQRTLFGRCREAGWDVTVFKNETQFSEKEDSSEEADNFLEKNDEESQGFGLVLYPLMVGAFGFCILGVIMNYLES